MRVLVIDDEKPLADTLVLILQGAGHEATAAYDGAVALSQSESFLPDVVISDVGIPGMNGIEICDRIQAQHPNCHIILFSGQAATSELIETTTSELMRRARATGVACELLAKPVHPRDLLAKLASIHTQSQPG